jgi:hypothetical protein
MTINHTTTIRRWGVLRESARSLDGGWFFSGRAGGGRENVRSRSTGSVFAGRHTLLNSPIFYVIYYILSSGSFVTSCFQTIANGDPDPRCPGQTRVLFNTLTTSSTYWRHTCGPTGPRSATDSTEQWVWCQMSYPHAVYVTCYFCCMFSLGTFSGITGSVRIYRSHTNDIHLIYVIYRCIPT